ncbi:MAG: XdhC family protein [Alphaproteobacteria bacterium]|nr:XdhC family protein [Alphaproteobacteria bacterium]
MLRSDAPPVCEQDHAALAAACEPGVALCTVVGIDGSFSRRIGAQLAVLPGGGVVGDLADGCLESQLAADVRACDGPAVRRYGRGSDIIDFRLPCGGGLDILLDPAPDREACRDARELLQARRPAELALPDNELLPRRRYIPALHLRAYGEGPELAALARLARASGIAIEALDKCELTLGQRSGLSRADRWTAEILLFHDHEWEAALIEDALAGEAFYIGAQGGENARAQRCMTLLARGVAEEDIARLRSPIGLLPACRTPQALALSVLAEVVGLYDRLR